MQRDIRNFCAPSESLTEENNNNVESDAVGHETQRTRTGACQPRKRRILRSLTPQEIQEQLNQSQDSQDSENPDIIDPDIGEALLREMEVDNEFVQELLDEEAADEAEALGLEVASQSQPEPGPSSATASARPSGETISAEDAERGLKVLQENLAGLGG